MSFPESSFAIQILEQAGVGLWRWDRRTGSVEWDDRCQSLFGLEPGTFAGTFQSWMDQVHPDDRQIVAAYLERAMESGETDLRFEHRCVWADGSIHWRECRGTLVYRHGQLQGGSGITIDVDDRLAVERERDLGFESERPARRSAESAWRRLSSLQKVAVRLAAASSVEEVGEALVNEGVTALEADTGLFSVVDPARGEISLGPTHGVGSQVIDFYRTIPVDSSNPVAEVVRSGKPIFVSTDEERIERWPELPYQGAAAFVLHPLTARGKATAVLAFGFTDNHEFSSDERELISTVAGMSSQAFHRAQLTDATERAVYRSSLLEGVTSRLVSGENAADIAQTIVGGLLPAVGAEAGGLFMVDRDQGALRTLAMGDRSGRTYTDQRSLDEPGPAADAIHAGRPIFIEDEGEWQRRYGDLDHAIRGPDVTATAHLPLIADGEAIATLVLGFAPGHRFDDSERQTLNIVAGICAQALGRAVALQEAREATSRLAAIDSITDTALSRLSVEELMQQLPERVAEATGSAAVRVLLIEGDFLHERGRFGAGDQPPGKVPIGRGLSGEVAATGQSQVVPDISQHEVIEPAYPADIAAVAGVPLRSEGRVIGVLDAGVGPERRFTSADVELLELAADRVAVAIDRTRAYEIERAGRRRSELLGQVGDLVNQGRSLPRMLRDLASVTVGTLADACVITVYGDEGQPLVVPSHPEAGWVEMATKATQAGMVARSARNGLALTADRIKETVDDPDLSRLLDRFDVGSVLSIPLEESKSRIGSILLARTGQSPSFGAQEASLARDVAERVTSALGRRLSFERHRTAALSLQRSLLPVETPRVPGFELATRYWPASDSYEVGGDFYDVIELPEDRWGILIGDVSGKGLSAAAMTGIARHTSRAAAVHGFEPDAVLRWLHDAFLVQSGTIETFCTGIYGILENANGVGKFRFAIGGHPFPVLRRPGEVSFVGGGGTVLGLIDPIHLEVSEVTLSPGDWLILYTDGVTDVPVAEAITDPELLDAIAEACVGSPEEALSSLERLIAARYGQVANRDDTAIVAVKFTGDLEGSG